MDMRGLSLEDLLARARTGDAEAAGEILRRHEDVIIAVIRSHLRGSSRAVVDTQDFLQSTAGVALRKLPFFEYQGDVPFRVWLRRIVENKLRQRQRDLLARPALDEDGSGDAGAPRAAVTDPGTHLEIEEVRKLVGEALTDLPEEARECHRLHAEDKLTFDEIAEHFGVSERTARRHFAKVEARLAMVARDYMDERDAAR